MNRTKKELLREIEDFKELFKRINRCPKCGEEGYDIRHRTHFKFSQPNWGCFLGYSDCERCGGEP